MIQLLDAEVKCLRDNIQDRGDTGSKKGGVICGKIVFPAPDGLLLKLTN